VVDGSGSKEGSMNACNVPSDISYR
jgi:hypothetical protein